MGCVDSVYIKLELRCWLVPGNVKNNSRNLMKLKRSLVPCGLRVPI